MVVGGPHLEPRRFRYLAPRLPRRIVAPALEDVAALRVHRIGGDRHIDTAIGLPRPVTASLLVALSDGLLEIAYLNDPKTVPGLVEAALARLLVRR